MIIYVNLEETCMFIYMQIAGASLFGILISKYDPVTCLKFATCLMVWSLPFAVMLLSLLLLTILITYSFILTINFQFSGVSHVFNQQAF